MRSRVRGRRRGYSLPASMAIISLLFITIASLFQLASASTRVTLRRKQGAQALNLAIAGLEDAGGQLRGNGGFIGFTDRPLGTGAVTVQVVTPAGQPLRRVVTSTATVHDLGQTITRSVRGNFELTDIPPIFQYALASKDTMDINGTVLVNSTPDLNQGNVHANGNLNVNSGADAVFGRADASGSATAHPSATITGGLFSGVPEVPFPDIDQDYKEQSLVNGSYAGNLAVGNGSMVQGKINGSLTVNQPNGCQVTGVVWVTGTLNISGPITGTGAIVCDGQLFLNCRYNYPAGSLTNLLVICTYSGTETAATLDGNRTFKGVIYVPYGQVSLQGNPTYLGAIIAKSIVFGGNPTITKWTDFDDAPPPMPRLCVLKGWQEL